MTEDEQRSIVVAEAKTWLGTPYVSNGDVKGAGVDCGMLLVRVFCDLKLIEPFDPRPYPAQWAMHQTEEIFLNLILKFSREISGPPLPGDVALFKFGRCWAHGSIVVDWPVIIHATPTINNKAVCRLDVYERNSSLRWRPVRFFSYWPQKEI